MKYTTDRPYADPEKAARRILEIANSLSRFRAASTSRKSTSRFFSATAAARPNTARASNSPIERGWLTMHESGTFVAFTPAGAEVF